jgi:HTH-type transcriptional regulator/antitoxin HipB
MTEQIARSPEQVGAAVRRRRRSLGLTQRNLAEKTGLRQATISGVEVGGSGTLRTFFDVLAALDMEVVVRPRTTVSNRKIAELF